MNEEILNETRSGAAPVQDGDKGGIAGGQPVMPDAEYEARTKEDDQNALAEARRKLMNLIRLKCGSLGHTTIENQLKPMVYSMSLADCVAMYDTLSKKGVLGLAMMLKKHQKGNKKK
jgi:hypothetical protein